MASSSLHFLTVLTEDDGVSGFKFERKPEEYTVDQLKRWLKYRGLKLSGKREDIVQRVKDCVRNGNYHTLDPASIVENGLLLKFKKILTQKQILARFPLRVFLRMAGVFSRLKTFLRSSTMDTCMTGLAQILLVAKSI